MALPYVLAGPLLRRTEASVVTVWIATRAGITVRGRVVRAGLPREEAALAEGEARSVRLGADLLVHLIRLEPGDARFPTDELLAYDIDLEVDGGDAAPSGLGMVLSSVVYGELGLPTFFIRESTPALNLLHGSCRLLHGGGDDAFLAVDGTIARRPGDVATRPSAMFLTGDQIYADYVAAPMIGHIRSLATELMGQGDDTSVPEMPRLSEVPVDERRSLILGAARFTSATPHNHLMSFGEFAAMYLTAWNEAVWPTVFPPASEALAGSQTRLRPWRRTRYESQRSRLEAARRALPSVRRVLANVPTYMTFDDHDVTDDWNLTRAWRDAVHESPSGRRIVANALASYWAFQGWGNDPSLFDAEFIDVVSGFLSEEGSVTGDAFDSMLWSFERWSYYAPTDPPTIVLDTRTQRAYDSPEGGARLLGADARRRVVELVRSSGYRKEKPLLVVSPVPVFGFELQERRQKYLVDKVGPYEIDFEAWHSNLRGLVDLMHLLVEEIDPFICILLSGDVHYGVNARASFVIEDKELRFVQLVSSGQKHAGAVSQSAVNSLGRVLRLEHVRLGWDEPPESKRKNALADRIMLRPVNSDEWADDSPVFLAPRDVRLLGVEQPPDFVERRVYVRPRGRLSSILVGENNTGLVSLESSALEHRLLARGRRGTTEHVVEIGLSERDWGEDERWLNVTEG